MGRQSAAPRQHKAVHVACNAMRPFLIIFSFLILIFSCKTKPSEKKETDAAVHPNSTMEVKRMFSAVDSLNKYIGTDSLYSFSDHPFFAGQFNEQDIGVVQLSDTSTLVYQKTNKLWLVTDTFNYPIRFVTPSDLNGDGYKDLIVTYSVSAAGANSENVALLFNFVSGQFRHNQYYDLPNIIYNKAKNKIFSAWWASAVHSQQKMAYKITGDSLVFEEGVSYAPDEKAQGNIATVEFYYRQGEKRIVTKKMKGKADKTLKIFTKALWDTSGE